MTRYEIGNAHVYMCICVGEMLHLTPHVPSQTLYNYTHPPKPHATNINTNKSPPNQTPPPLRKVGKVSAVRGEGEGYVCSVEGWWSGGCEPEGEGERGGGEM